jgi:hypothetical protein
MIRHATRERRLLASAIFLSLAAATASASAVTGAELIRNEPLRYGRFEARIQFAPGDGVVSSFFLWKSGSEMDDIFWNEIDIEKLGDDCTRYASNALYGLPQTNHSQQIPAPTDLCGAYHTHAIEWTPDRRRDRALSGPPAFRLCIAIYSCRPTTER